MAAAQDDDEDAITGINITPLVDIILVLLIVFMMTASYIVTPAIEINLPKAANAEAALQSTLALVISKEGQLYVNNRPASDDDLRRFIRAERAKYGEELQAVIAADAAVQHGRVVGLIDLVKGEGVVKFALNTQAEFSAPPPDAPEGDPAAP
jgi:biopolymer transport protein ExbD